MPAIRQKVFKTMTVEEFLHEENTNRWSEVYINKNGNVEYKNMVIIKDSDHKPINEKTAYSDTELILLFRAQGDRPEERGCDPTDIVNNGTLGCYLD